MKLFLYYSFTGNGDYLASLLKDKGYEIRKVTEKKKMPKSFFFGVLVGGFRAGMKQKAKLVDYNPDVSEYDEIVIGSPIWNGRFPPVLNSILALTDFSNKKVTFLFYSGSGTGPKAEEWVKLNMPDASIIFTKEPKKYQEELIKIKDL